MLTRRQIQYAEAKKVCSLDTDTALWYVYWSPLFSGTLTLCQRIKLSRFQRWQNLYRKALSSNGQNVGLPKYSETEHYNFNNRAEIGDYVEQDEEIATIETDKVQAVHLRCGWSLH